MLADCKNNIIVPHLSGGKLEFDISGLEIMNDDPSDVDVLYGKIVDKTGKLQSIVDAIGMYQFVQVKFYFNHYMSWNCPVEKFVQSGLMKREYDRVKLHATLLNTLFRKDEGDLGDKLLTKVLN